MHKRYEDYLESVAQEKVQRSKIDDKRKTERESKRRRVVLATKKRKKCESFEVNSGSTAKKAAKEVPAPIETEGVSVATDNPVRSVHYNLRPRVSRGSYRGHTR